MLCRDARSSFWRCWAILICLIGLAIIVIANSRYALAQDNDTKWPDHPVRFIVPFPAGSESDIIARIVAQKLTTELGQPFVIDNRSGASGVIGAEAIARAKPDGYTIGLATNSTHAVAPSVDANLSYDPMTDFAPVSMIGSSPYVLLVNAAVPAQNVAELIALAKAKPHALSCASVGPASLAYLAGKLFSHLAGVELTDVPYRSSSQAVLDVAAGRIEMQFGTILPTLPFIRAGKLRALAVTGTKRIDALPDVPTLQEVGLAGYEAVLWMAVVMPAASPSSIVARLNRAMRNALATADVAATLKAQEMQPELTTPDALRERIRIEIAKWRSVAALTGVKAEP
ncbi:MAG: tripartite tricarboxylate transporter substrate binding protein [Xanthobacteraceae bacterium]